MDILRELLLAYQSDLQTQRQAGGALTWLAYEYVIQTPELLPPDWSAELPCILIYPNDVQVSQMCLGGHAAQKNYEITLSILCEGYADETAGLFGQGNYYKGVLTMAQEVETRYFRETFSLSQAAEIIRMSYTLRRIPPFLHKGINQAHLTFRHLHFDMRD